MLKSPAFSTSFLESRMIQKLKSRKSRIKPGLFAFLLAERIIFGKKTQTCGEQFAHRRFFYSEVFVPALVAGIFFVNASQKKPPSGAAQLPACRWLDSAETRNVSPHSME